MCDKYEGNCKEITEGTDGNLDKKLLRNLQLDLWLGDSEFPPLAKGGGGGGVIYMGL